LILVCLEERELTIEMILKMTKATKAARTHQTSSMLEGREGEVGYWPSVRGKGGTRKVRGSSSGLLLRVIEEHEEEDDV